MKQACILTLLILCACSPNVPPHVVAEGWAFNIKYYDTQKRHDVTLLPRAIAYIDGTESDGYGVYMHIALERNFAPVSLQSDEYPTIKLRIDRDNIRQIHWLQEYEELPKR